MSQSLYFIAKVASDDLLVVGLLVFPLFSCRPKKIALNVEVHGQVNSKAIYNDFLPESLILRLMHQSIPAAPIPHRATAGHLRALPVPGVGH